MVALLDGFVIVCCVVGGVVHAVLGREVVLDGMAVVWLDDTVDVFLAVARVVVLLDVPMVVLRGVVCFDGGAAVVCAGVAGDVVLSVVLTGPLVVSFLLVCDAVVEGIVPVCRVVFD